MNAPTRFVERVRHDLKLRMAEVAKVERITPKMARITLASPEFSDFVSLGYDDHVKLFFPEPGEKTMVQPQAGPDGLRFPEGRRPPARDYTPRFFDTKAGTLVIDFVIHGDGPASIWAETAAPGDVIGVGGPRGSFVVHGQYDWYLLAGDETALPAIGRRIEELGDAGPVIAVIEIAGDAERQDFSAHPDCEIVWVSRRGAPPGNPAPLLDALAGISLPEGEGYVFIAGEQAMSRAARAYFTDTLGQDPDRIKAAGYWQAGTEDFDDGHAH